MKFFDDKPIVCNQCGELLTPPTDYLKYKGENYCSEQCLGSVLVEEKDQEIERLQLLTAEDHEMNYADIKYNEQF